jgi:hypothetical protein
MVSEVTLIRSVPELVHGAMDANTELREVRLNLGSVLVTLPANPEIVMMESTTKGTLVLIVAVMTFWPPGYGLSCVILYTTNLGA